MKKNNLVIQCILFLKKCIAILQCFFDLKIYLSKMKVSEIKLNEIKNKKLNIIFLIKQKVFIFDHVFIFKKTNSFTMFQGIRLFY